MIDADLLALLRCPVHRTPLELALDDTLQRVNAGIAAGEVRDAADQKVTQPLEGGLFCRAGSLLYPIRDGIACLVADEAISVDESLGPPATTA